MKYDFTSILDRDGKDSIIEQAKHPAYGYFETKQEYYDSIICWQEKRNRVTGLAKECIGYENGVLGGVISALNVFCSRGDCVLLHSPTYIGFTGSLTNNGYKIVHSPLVLDAGGIWRMDFADMEEKIKKYHKNKKRLLQVRYSTGCSMIR